MSEQLQTLAFDTAIDEIQKRQNYFLLHRALATIVEMLKVSAAEVQLIQEDENVPDQADEIEYTDLTPTEEE